MKQFCAIILILPTLLFSQTFAEDILIPEIKVLGAGDSDGPTQQVDLPTDSKKLDLSKALQELPNLSRTGGANRSRFFQIRGVGDREQFEHSQVNPVGVFYEGIDLSEEASTLPLFGGEKIKVRYGPQTQSWGSKAIAGSLEVESCLTNPQCGSQVKIGGDEFATLASAATLKSKSDYFLSAGYLHSDGPYNNSYYGKPTHTRSEAEFVGGASHQLEAHKLSHHHLFINHDNGYDTWNFDRSFTTLSDHPGKDRHQVHGHSLLWEKPNLTGQWTNLLSVTFTQQLESYDEDWGNNVFWNDVAGWNADYNYFSEFERRRLKLHEKLFYSFNSGFELGAHFYEYREKQIIRSYNDENSRRFAESDLRSHNIALIASQKGKVRNTEWKISVRGESQSAELRQNEKEEKSTVMWGADLKTETVVTPGFAIGFLLQRGFRGGSFNTDSSLPLEQKSFGPESVVNSELNLNWNPDSYIANLRVFSFWYRDQQVKTSLQLDPTDPSTFSYFTSNVGESRAVGSELSLQKSWSRFKLRSNLGLLNSEIEKYKVAGRDLNGRDFSDAPKWNASLKAEYFKKRWSLYSEYKAFGSYYYSLDHDLKSPSVNLIDAGVQYALESWAFHLWGTNVFDQKYATRAYYFANEPPAWEQKLYLQNADPRRIGAEVIYHF